MNGGTRCTDKQMRRTQCSETCRLVFRRLQTVVLLVSNRLHQALCLLADRKKEILTFKHKEKGLPVQDT